MDKSHHNSISRVGYIDTDNERDAEEAGCNHDFSLSRRGNFIISTSGARFAMTIARYDPSVRRNLCRVLDTQSGADPSSPPKIRDEE